MLWLLCLLFQQVQGDFKLSRTGISAGGVVATGGKYQLMNLIGKPLAPVRFKSGVIEGGAGPFAGLENPPVADTVGAIKGTQNGIQIITHNDLLSLLKAYDPDGNAITATIEALAGTIIGVTGAGSLVLNEGESLSWQPPLNKAGAIEAMRVRLNDNRLAKEVVALVTVNIDGGIDTVPPVLTLQGVGQVSIAQGATYVDAGVSATDNVDGNLTAKIVVSGEVDASTLGTYTLKYDVSDAAGNAAKSVSRMVVVQKSSVTQTLSLTEGWNLISFYVEAEDMAPATVLSSIKGNLVLIKDLKSSYIPTLPSFLNTLKGLNVKDGYWVNVDGNVSFELEGVVPAGASITVRTGWNLVGYPRETGAAPGNELTSLGSKVQRFKNLKSSFDPALPPFLNTLKVMTPGLGYWLEVNEDGVWNVGDVSGEGGNRDISKMGLDESRWGQVVVYPNVSATVLAQVTAEGKAVSRGSVVGVFVGDELRGQQEVVLADANSYVALNANLTKAEKVSFRIWDSGNNKDYPVVKTMTLEMGEMYGTAEKLVNLDGAVPKVGVRILSYTQSPFVFEFKGEQGRNYVVEATGDLKEWKLLKTLSGVGSDIKFTDTRKSIFEKQYYRVKALE
jgi:hypothetical protein